MKDISKNAYMVHGWFLTELGLKGSELQVFSIIYGYIQKDNGEYYGSLDYLEDWTGLSKRNIIRTINSLIEKGLIKKTESTKFKPSRYIAGDKLSHDSMTKCHTVDDKMSHDSMTKCHSTLYEEKDIKKKNEDIPPNPQLGACHEIIFLFNSICISYPKVTKLSEARKKSIKARLKSYGIDDFRLLFEIAESNNFLKGSNNKNWIATFDWLIKDSNMAKTLDGNYNNFQPPPKGEHGNASNNGNNNNRFEDLAGITYVRK